MVQKILEKVPPELLQRDLERYRRKAIDLGATDAKIMTTDMVLVDERVRAKCYYPKCPHFGTNANCPPYTMEVDLVRKVVRSYQYSIFFKLDVPPETMAGPTRNKINAPSRKQYHDIVSTIESEAFYDGYYLALGFAGGACKNVYCPNDECSALVPGKSCRHPLKARPAMEGMGIDAYLMAAKVGWDIYPIGRATVSSEVPCASILGLVLIH